MILSPAISKLINDKHWLTDFLFSFRNTNNVEAWSDNEAELFSHMEIMNRSALLTISDLKGNITHANDLFCSVSKYTFDEVINKPHSIIRHPETPDSVFKEMWRTIGNGKVWQGELRNRAKDNTDYWVLATIAPVMGSNGKPIRYISVRYDITAQKKAEEELRIAKEKIDNELYENLTYAKHIHSSFLTNDEGLKPCNDSFLLYKARKIISGDFYKIERRADKIMVVVGDSTGHGISASYISVLALNVLARAMGSFCQNPGKILKMINSELNRITHLNEQKKLIETADMIVCCIDKKTMKLTYASAKMKAFILRGEEVVFLEKDKCTIGEQNGKEFKITNRSIDLQKGDRFYSFSDGLTDQFGGFSNKKLGLKKLVSIVADSKRYPMTEQKKVIERAITEWQGNNEQTDDITVFGIEI